MSSPVRHMVATAIAAALLLLLSAPLQAQAQRLYRVTFRDAADLASFASMLDVWEVDHHTQTLLAPLTDAQAAELRLQRRLELARDQSPLHVRFAATDVGLQGAGIPGFACYRTVEETAATLAELAATAPHLARLVTIGNSWEWAPSSGASGYDLQVLVVTNQATAGPKPVFFLMGALHARELTTAETALRFAEELLAGYGSDPVSTWLLDHAELHVLPMANPDGRKRAEEGLLWRKNTNSSAGQCSSPYGTYGTYGIDLNRNSSFQWGACPGCSSSAPCSDIYRGVQPASEPETQAIEGYLRSVIDSRRSADFTTPTALDTPGLLISLHSYGQLILYPWGWTTSPAPNRDGLHTLGLKFGYHTNYKVCQAGANNCLYQTDGTTDDWAYGELGIAAYTIELGTAFFQSCTAFESDILPSALASLRYAFLVAARPYSLPAGPDILELTVTPESATSLRLDLHADATRYAGGANTVPLQAVVAARYALNLAPWEPPVPTWPFQVFASDAENGRAGFSTLLDASCVPAGRHTVVAQAMNQSGDWGAPAVQFISGAGDGSIQAEMSSEMTAAGVRVAHTLTITNSGNLTATYSLTPLPFGWDVDLPNPLVGPLSPGASTSVSVIVIPPNLNAEAIAPAGVEIRSVEDATACAYVYAVTEVNHWTVRLPFVFKNGASPAP